jgi:hypothetical protein
MEIYIRSVRSCTQKKAAARHENPAPIPSAQSFLQIMGSNAFWKSKKGKTKLIYKVTGKSVSEALILESVNLQ